MSPRLLAAPHRTARGSVSSSPFRGRLDAVRVSVICFADGSFWGGCKVLPLRQAARQPGVTARRVLHLFWLRQHVLRSPGHGVRFRSLSVGRTAEAPSPQKRAATRYFLSTRSRIPPVWRVTPSAPFIHGEARQSRFCRGRCCRCQISSCSRRNSEGEDLVDSAAGLRIAFRIEILHSSMARGTVSEPPPLSQP